MRGPGFPEFRVRFMCERVQIRHHCGAMFGFVANAARSREEVFAHLANRGFDVTTGTVTFEHGLAVGFDEFLIAFTVVLRHGSGGGWLNRRLYGKHLPAF